MLVGGGISVGGDVTETVGGMYGCVEERVMKGVRSPVRGICGNGLGSIVGVAVGVVCAP